jgi:hypothetical protein
MDSMEEIVRGIVNGYTREKPIKAADICAIMARRGITITRRSIADIASETRLCRNGQPPILALKGGKKQEKGYYIPRKPSDYPPWFREQSATQANEKRKYAAVQRRYKHLLQQKSDQGDLFIGIHLPTPDPAGEPPFLAGLGDMKKG